VKVIMPRIKIERRLSLLWRPMDSGLTTAYPRCLVRPWLEHTGSVRRNTRAGAVQGCQLSMMSVVTLSVPETEDGQDRMI